jgi:LacI family transcriptional regulator
VLQWPRPAFCRGFAEQWQIAVRTRAEIRGGCDIRFSASQDIDAYTRTIEATPAASSAIAIAAPNHPKLVRLFEEISSGEMPVFTMLNDLTQQHRSADFGADNIKVRRLAAWMSATKPGSKRR